MRGLFIGFFLLMGFQDVYSSCKQNNQLNCKSPVSFREQHASMSLLKRGRFFQASQDRVSRRHQYPKTERGIRFVDEPSGLMPRMVPTQVHKLNGTIIEGSVQFTGAVQSMHYVITFYGQDTPPSRMSWFSKCFFGCYSADAVIQTSRVRSEN